MTTLYCVVSSNVGFLCAEVVENFGSQNIKLYDWRKEPVEEYAPAVYMVCDKFVSLDEAAEFCLKAKELEKVLRPFWQAAYEHQERMKQMMLDIVYSAATKKDS